MPTPPFVLVDGSSYLFRAFYAMPPLTTASGQPTGAAYGVVNMLKSLIQDVAPTHMAVIFDSKEKTFRHEQYAEYKAQRTEMPDDLAVQIAPLFDMIKALGIPLLVQPGVEADDIIATLAIQAAAAGTDVLISTGDKDIAQLVNPRITLINTMNNVRLDEAGVMAKFGVSPAMMVDYLALTGDNVDNIPGIPGVGPKTAVKWLNTYHSLENIITHANEISGKVGENLRAHVNLLTRARSLVTLKTDVQLDTTPGDLTLMPADIAKLQALYTQLEFKRWLKELDQTPAQPETKKSGYELITTETQLTAWVKKLDKAALVAMGIATTDPIDAMAAEWVGVSLAVNAGEAAYIPIAHDYPGAPAQLSRDYVIKILKPLLEDANKAKLGHHLKYDKLVLSKYNIELKGLRYDSLLESYVLNSISSRHDFDALCQQHLNHINIRYEDIVGKGAKQIRFNQVVVDEACAYAAEDADMTLQLHQFFWPQLCETPSLQTLFETIEMPLVSVLADMEQMGVLVDVPLLNAQSQRLAARMHTLSQSIYTLAGHEFNVDSPKQLQEVLFEKLGLPVTVRTPTGQPSTAEPVLQALAENHELPQHLLEYRTLAKLKSTYTDRLPECVNPKTGRVHTSFHQAVTSTGRLSSSDPNLQNIPIRTEEGRRIRQAFIAPSNHFIVAADYSQIELRIMAHLSGDPSLLAAFKANEDIHQATAAEVFGVAKDKVDKEQRRHAKAINFGLIYGMSSFGLAKQLHIDRKSAETYIQRYFTRYPGVKNYMDKMRQQAATRGYVETLFGRRLYIEDIHSKNMGRRQAAERIAINAPMQGTAADIIKRAMIAMHQWLKTNPLSVRMILQVHDELVFEVEKSMLDKAINAIRQAMGGAADLAVPLIVEIGHGANWDEAHG